MDKRVIEALLDIYNKQEEAVDKFNKYWYEVERVVNEDIRNSFVDVEQALYTIQSIVTEALGGAAEVVRLQNAREQEQEREWEQERAQERVLPPECRMFLLDDNMLDNALETTGAYTGPCVIEVFPSMVMWDKTSPSASVGNIVAMRFRSNTLGSNPNDVIAKYLSGAYNLVFFRDNVFEWALQHIVSRGDAYLFFGEMMQIHCVGTAVIDTHGRTAHATSGK